MWPSIGTAGSAASAILLLCIFSSVNSFSKYGRGCNDIGCLPSEECVITSDSCSYTQREGKDCGNYPKCQRKPGSSSSSSAPVNPSGSSYKPGPEHAIFSSASSNPTLNTHTYYSSNGGGSSSSATGSNSSPGGGINNINGYANKNSNNVNSNYGNNGHDDGGNDSPGSAQKLRPNGGTGGIDPHYVFGAPQSVPVLPNLPIFPYNSPTQAPSFQQFPQPNHPGSVLNPGYPGSLQPVNPYSPSFVFGQQPYYSMPGGTGGPPGGSNGILGGSGGGLAPPSGYYGNSNVGYQNANMYNKPPPQYQNQNPYNRQTQPHPSGAAHRRGAVSWQTLTLVACGYALLTALVSQRLACERST
ncbi:RNA-binding protein FUS isoform X2 [Rhagoletis pomonella]|uniref:RNA-binding protein FUS isoform X2 n=1 Tax=Rhagoletis pomonella TaxID=28610 RepID=UPI001781CCB4|nr:RNA-binding protein FUS isoform X2 [Rhagoletis pomonella]